MTSRKDAMDRESAEFKDLSDRTIKMQNIHKMVERTLVVEVNI